MAKVMEVNGADLAALFSGGRPAAVEPERTPEERLAEAQADYARCVRNAGATCPDSAHRAVHELAEQLVASLYRTQVMPERVRRAYVHAYVSLKLHGAESPGEAVRAMLADGGAAFIEGMLLVGAVALACGVAPEPDGAAAPISGASDDRAADLRAGYL